MAPAIERPRVRPLSCAAGIPAYVSSGGRISKFLLLTYQLA